MRYIITASICCLLMASCSNDFDEVKDTDQRNITLNVECSSIFDEVLVQTNSDYTLGSAAIIPDSMRLRLSAYCYDTNDSLITKKTILTTDACEQQLTIRHLLKDHTYHFAVIADIVKYDPYIDYYETWFQLKTSSLDSLYFYSRNKDVNPCFNIIHSSQFDIIPDNQTVPVTLESLIYNGYCVFVNAQGFDKVSGYAGFADTFTCNSLTVSTRIKHNFSYFSPQSDTFTIPVTMSKTNDYLSIRLETNQVNKTDTVYLYPQMKQRPFVVTIDCKTLSIKDIKQY